MRDEELLIRGATELATSRQVCARAHRLRETSDWNIAFAKVLRGRRPSLSGGTDGVDGQLRDRIRALMDSGVLPRQPASKLWVVRSPGGRECIACQYNLRQGEMEYEVVLGDTVTIQLHRHCFEMWTAEVASSRS
jgi:hypothetical protein